MALLILYEVHEQTVWTKNIRFKASERQRKGEERKMIVYFFHSGFPLSALSVTT